MVAWFPVVISVNFKGFCLLLGMNISKVKCTKRKRVVGVIKQGHFPDKVANWNKVDFAGV